MNVRRELEELGLKSRKRFSQNFLCQPQVADLIVDKAGISADDVVIEIGTGLGMLTTALAKRARDVITFEIDRKLAVIPTRDLNIEIIRADFLKYDLTALQKKYPQVKVVSNLPFHISTEVMFRLFERRKWIESMTLMFQKEVAERIVSRPGTKAYGILSVLSQLYSEPKKVLAVSRDKFYPPPDVSAAVIHFQMKKELIIQEGEEPFFVNSVKSAFGQRRKILLNSLQKIAPTEVLKKVEGETGIDMGRRAETLSLGEFKKISESIYLRAVQKGPEPTRLPIQRS